MYTVNGYELMLMANGLNYFSKKETAGCLEIVCTDEQLKNGDIQFMTKHGLTLSPERIRKEVRKFLRKHT